MCMPKAITVESETQRESSGLTMIPDVIFTTISLIRDAYVNINIGYEASPPLSSCTISNNTSNYACHMIRSGDDGANAYATNYVVSFNTMGPNQQAWKDLNTGCHSNGIFITIIPPVHW